MIEGKTKYYYMEKDVDIINQFIKDNGKTMEFIKEEE